MRWGFIIDGSYLLWQPEKTKGSIFAAPLHPLLLAGAALAGLGSAFVEPAMGSIYLAATSDDNRSQVMGMRGSAISLAVMLGPLAQALVGPWITPQITFAIGVALSLSVETFWT